MSVSPSFYGDLASVEAVKVRAPHLTFWRENQKKALAKDQEQAKKGWTMRCPKILYHYSIGFIAPSGFWCHSIGLQYQDVKLGVVTEVTNGIFGNVVPLSLRSNKARSSH